MNSTINDKHKEALDKIYNENALDEINNKFNSLSEVFNGDNFIPKEFVKENKKRIFEITEQIAIIRSSMNDNGIIHDIETFISNITKINIIAGFMFENQIDNIFNHYNEALNFIVNNKDIFSVSETFDIIKTKALHYKINLDFTINSSNNGSGNFILNNGNETFNNKEGLLSTLENGFPNINFNMKRLLDNLIKNSREAGATDIKVDFKESSKGNIIIEYTDNGHGISKDVLLNVLFAEGESTKLDSGINSGEGMHGLSKLFSDKKVYLNIISKTNDEYVSKSFLPYSFSEIASGNTDIDELVFHNDSIEDIKFPYETGTKFIFEFNQKEVL